MFKTKRVKQENTAAAVPGIPRPPQTIINNQASEAAVILARWFVYLVLAVIVWFFLLYLLEEMGAKKPEKALGWFLFGGTGLLIVAFAVDRTLTKYAKMRWDYQVIIEEIRAERDRALALTAGAPALPAKRLTAEQMRFYENLALVMQRAYQDLADSEGVGYQGGSDKRPWSKRSVLTMDPPRHGKMPDSKAAEIRAWLAEHNVIVGDPQNDQINTGLYPTFADFQTLLKEAFDMPVVVRSNKALPSPTDRGYVHIDI